MHFFHRIFSYGQSGSIQLIFTGNLENGTEQVEVNVTKTKIVTSIELEDPIQALRVKRR